MRQLRFIFRQVIFRAPRAMRGSSDVAVEARVDGSPVGNPYDSFTVRPRGHINLDPASYSAELDTQNRSDVIEMRFVIRFDEPGNTAELGSVTHRIPWPYSVRDFRD